MSYAQRHTWRGNSDNDLYKICRGSADIRTGWGGWKNTQPKVRRDMVGIPESEKINAYALSSYICNQVSTPERASMAIPATDILPHPDRSTISTPVERTADAAARAADARAPHGGNAASKTGREASKPMPVLQFKADP